jgi:hypothetical protein
MMFMLRNNRLRTRQREHETMEKEKNQQNTNYYILRRRRYFSENKCPMGCENVEDIQHLCECKHAEKFREEARARIKWVLTTRGVAAEKADIKEWNTIPEWKEKYTWLGMIPKTFTEELKNFIEGEKEISEITTDITRYIMEAMKNTWAQRCKKLFEKEKCNQSEPSQPNTTTHPSTPNQKKPRTPPQNPKPPKKRAPEQEQGPEDNTTKKPKKVLRQPSVDRDYRPSAPTPRQAQAPKPRQPPADTDKETTDDTTRGLDGGYWEARSLGRSKSGRRIRQTLSTHQSIPTQENRSTLRPVLKPPAVQGIGVKERQEKEHIT